MTWPSGQSRATRAPKNSTRIFPFESGCRSSGFGERVENPEDRRSFLLRLNPKGVSAWRAAGERLGKIVASLDKRLDRPAGEIQDALLALQAAFDSELAASEEPARR